MVGNLELRRGKVEPSAHKPQVGSSSLPTATNSLQHNDITTTNHGLKAVVHIPLTQGLVAIIDASDYALISRHKWYAARRSGSIYAVTKVGRTVVLMHRLLLGAVGKVHIDHRDSDGLNNRRINLRKASPSQNSANSRLSRGNKTGFKGVRITRQGKFQAYITKNRRRFTLGAFSLPEEAARTYDAKALELFGEFARLNFPAGATQ